jgi:hypothetical protein
MNKSENINELAAALAKAQGEFQNLEKNREVEVTMKSGGKYKFRYATFDEAVAMVRPVLSKNDLAVTQSLSINDAGQVVVETMLLHSSGQWINQEIPIIPDSSSPQAVGSAATYGRRYGLSAMLSLASEDDDDGNLASGNHAVVSTREPKRQPPKRETPKAEPPAMPPEQAEFNAWVKPLIGKNGLTAEYVRDLVNAGHTYSEIKQTIEDLMKEGAAK